MRQVRLARAGAITASVLCAGLYAAQAAGAAGTVPGAAVSPRQPMASAAGAFHQTKTISRINLINGQNVLVDRRKVALSVDTTTNLINRQVINVTWSGAHPTGGIHLNPNDGADAQFDEYPMVLLECHGRPGSHAPLAAQIAPQDCWASTPMERYFASADPFPAWRLDRYATAAGQRDLHVHQPTPLPSGCFVFGGLPNYWLHYVSPSGTNYPIGPPGGTVANPLPPCAGMPNEMSLIGGIGLQPSVETFAATQIDGRGSASFDVWTSEVNPDLGCSQKVPCALVAVPVMGISCDPAAAGMPPADQPTPAEEPAAAAACEQTGNWLPGTIDATNVNSGALAVSGELWWAASNWRNRFVVPLHFAPPQNICSVASKNNRFLQIYGSELMDQAMLQWQPHFCLSRKLFSMTYVRIPEPEAAGQLAVGTIEAALVSNQPSTGFARPVIHAPLAETGFAVSFVIDNAHGLPVAHLRLDARLLAKLMTESYPGFIDIAHNDKEILHACPGVPVPGSNQCTNPLNITLDPEFQALNPRLPKGVGASAAASALLSLSSDTDVTWALTSYINANPAARAWLNGKPDPWGMTVNKKYKKIALPVSIWPLLSTYEPQGWISGGQGPGPCYAVNPSPVLPLIASPVPDLVDLAADVQFNNSQSQLVCVGNPDVPLDYHLGPLGPQVVGFRFMIGITTIADAHRYHLGTASLLTHIKAGTPRKFTSPRGMTFVGPTDAGLRAAAALLAPDTTNRVWTFPYSLYKSNSAKAAPAYPGSMLVYADIATKGLKSAAAANYAALLRFAVGKGQRPGGGVGQLPAGYLPLTAANHLGAQAASARADAAAVAAQAGALPALITNNNSAGPSPSPSPSSSAGPGSSSSPGPSASGSSSPGATPPTSSPGANIALTPLARFGIAGYVLPVLLGLALLAGAAALVFSRMTRPRAAESTETGRTWRSRLGVKRWS